MLSEVPELSPAWLRLKPNWNIIDVGPEESKLLTPLLNYPTNCTHKLFNSLAAGSRHCLFSDGLIPSSQFIIWRFTSDHLQSQKLRPGSSGESLEQDAVASHLYFYVSFSIKMFCINIWICSVDICRLQIAASSVCAPPHPDSDPPGAGIVRTRCVNTAPDWAQLIFRPYLDKIWLHFQPRVQISL